MHPLLDVACVDRPLADHLAASGDVFVTIGGHDSGNTSYGVAVAGERWFVKHASDVAPIAVLENAIRFHAAVRHPAIVPLAATLRARDGLALVHPWRAGEVLNDPLLPGGMHRDDPGSSLSRFRALSVPEIVGALDAIVDAHVAVARAGFVAVDFYDGAIMYDFAARAVHLVDLDSYSPPYTLDRDRQFGSTRFMAPEESQRGAAIDERATVFTLGRTAFVLLGEANGWRADPRRRDVALRATAPRPADRFATVAELDRAWRGRTT